MAPAWGCTFRLGHLVSAPEISFLTSVIGALISEVSCKVHGYNPPSLWYGTRCSQGWSCPDRPLRGLRSAYVLPEIGGSRTRAPAVGNIPNQFSSRGPM